tara:strand:+ start:490 stop:1047 length:558 start_codon:yes stop_codon:yes gene_type:complete
MDSLQTILQKLFIFRDCRAAHIRDVLKICSSRTFKADERLCSQGEKSEEMFIVLSGRVEIDAADGLPLLSETAVTIIGEVGMLTGESRLATVVAQTDVKTLVISRSTLMPKLSEDPVLASLIYRNVLFMERSKLIASNQRIAQLLQDVAEGEEYAASDEDEEGEVEEDDYEAGEGGDAAEEVEAA